jgi:hypothetical protein
MTTRETINSVIRGLRRDQELLAAYLQASAKIDWRALHKPIAIDETPEPLNAEAEQASTAPLSHDVLPSKSSFVFRRTNLVRGL